MQHDTWYDVDLEQLIDDEEPTWPYRDLGYDHNDVGASEISVRRLPSGEMEVTVVRPT